ncbi:MAG TPA: ATP-binding protein [Ktedonobacteraceae bacterium]|nr:ATP-binding protein [Ktedonobacteraceae bacterium]
MQKGLTAGNERKWQHFFFTARLRRAILEAASGGCAVWLLIFVLYSLDVARHMMPIVAPTIIITVNPLVVLFFALRLRLVKKIVSRQALNNLLSFLVLDIVLNTLGTLVVVKMLPAYAAHVSSPLFLWVMLLLNILDAGWFIFVRITSLALRHWDQLRRKELRWAITHAHVMIVAFTMGLLIIFVEIIGFLTPRGNLNIFELIPTLFLMLGLSAIPIVIVVPPLALFSYYVTRSTVSRVQTLAKATSALRAGDYEVRVPVVGEDEVAQLQSDFNVMAHDLERAMHDLQSERDRVATLLQERRELIANVSHELRTPVATLRGYLETTLEHWDQSSHGALYQDIRVMEGETLQLQERIEELFTLARAELGRLPLHCEAVEGAQLVQHIVEGSAPLAWRASKIEITADIQEQVAVVYADPQRLEQSLRNLLHNAQRHTAPGGIIVLSLSQTEQRVCFTVKDTGEGIAAEDLPYIWNRFYQAKNSPMRKRGGSGLGLALVKQWIEGMGGTVEVESRPGAGSCFNLYLQPVSSTELKTGQLASTCQEVQVTKDGE